MQTKVVSLLLVLALACRACSAARHLSEPPSFLRPCDFKDDTSFDTCFVKNFQVLFREWKDGIPGLKSLGSLDPLPVKRVKIQQDGGPAININAELENMVITGASQAVVKEAILDKKTFVVRAKIYVPKIHVVSDYKVKGSVLGLNVNGEGKVTFDTGKLALTFQLSTKLRDDGELTFSEIVGFKAQINEVGEFHINAENLFGGQKELEDTANDLFNQNWRELYEVLHPSLEQTLELILKDRFQKIYAFVPANYFISNMPTANELYG